MMTAIIDYEIGNLCSVKNALDKIGQKSKIENDPQNLKKFDKIILPGVGAFGDGIFNLKKKGFDDALREIAKEGKPILGICLGMQLLFEKSEESEKSEGLGIIQGEVKAFDSKRFKEKLKIPQMGWNTVKKTGENKIFKNLPQEFYLYFVHSFYVVCPSKFIIGKTQYGYEFTSAVSKDNIYGFQAHPEKSHDLGLGILKNFTEL